MLETERRASTGRFWQIILILLALETGLFLTLMPWSSVWDDQLVSGYFSVFRPILGNHFLRGALSGLGLINLWVGIVEAMQWTRSAGSAPGPGASD